MWQLDPNLNFFNHGSFGSTPIVVRDAQRRFQEELERDPIRFLAIERELEPKLDHVRTVVANLVGAPANDLGWVRTATDGVNAVLRSFPLSAGDEVVFTNHGYNACNNAARFVAERAGATVKIAKIPFPLSDPAQVVAAIERELSPRTRLMLIDHVTSPTGLVFPIDEVIRLAREHGVRILVDGAHAAGMLPLDLGHMAPDYYTANHHKWLCSPKVSAFLYVRPELQDEVRPTVISHGANRQDSDRSRFTSEFDWMGTFDPTPLMSVPTAIEFLSTLHPGGINELMKSNRALALQARDLLCERLSVDAPCPDAMIGSLVSVPLPATGALKNMPPEQLMETLYNRDRIEVPIFRGPTPNTILVRMSLQAYNRIEQVEKLAQALKREL